MNAILRLWFSLNYRYCKANEYLALQRGDIIQAINESRAAFDWKFKYDHVA